MIKEAHHGWALIPGLIIHRSYACRLHYSLDRLTREMLRSGPKVRTGPRKTGPAGFTAHFFWIKFFLYTTSNDAAEK